MSTNGDLNFDFSQGMRPHSFTTQRVLKRVEEILEKIYGDDHEKWHEMCLEAKHQIKMIQMAAGNNPTAEQMDDWRRKVLVKVLLKFEVHE